MLPALNVLRWVAVLPVAIVLHGLILAAYAPVGEFLGGYFWVWTYQLTALVFFFLASLVPISAALIIAPSHRPGVGLAGVAIAVVLACSRLAFSRNPQWSVWYCIAYLAVVLAGALLPYLVAREIDEAARPAKA